MDKTRVKSLFIGLLIGVIGLIFGFFLFSWLYIKMTHITPSYFKNNMDMIFNNSPTQLATGILIPNFLLFYWFMKKEKNMFSQGIMLICIGFIIFSLLY